MRAIDKFILHVVHNWKNELNEAYSEKAVQGFINKFKEEADDLNINITDDQLRAYISTFDRIKEKLPGDQRDLTKWTLSKFVKLVTSTKGAEAAEEMDITPDVVYHNENDTIVIYNGSKENNCIRYGRGEKWCITRSSFSSYRYSEGKSYPTFYLAKNNNLSDSDRLSFVAIQVRNPQTTREDNRYVYTNRDNSPYESRPMSFEELMSEVPWLREVPNIKTVLKYIPLSTGEKFTQQYRGSSIPYREWTNLPFSAKQQYLVVRKGGTLFTDVKTEEFVEKYLPKFPELAKFIAETPGIIDTIILLKNLDQFSNQVRRSITANVQEKINTRYLPTETLSFDVKKLLVQLNKWDVRNDERLYITKDGDTIVKITLGDDMEVGLYQAEDDYPKIKLNKRTAKYLLDYPELDKIPLRNLVKLAGDGVINKDVISSVIDTAKGNPDSALIVKAIESGEIILDSNSFSSYKIDKNGSIVSIPFNNEEVQQVFTDAKDNESFQQNALNLFRGNQNIPATIDKDALKSVINAIPYNQRTVQVGDIPSIVLTTATEGTSGVTFFLMPSNIDTRYQRSVADYGYGGRNEWRGRDNNNNLDLEQWASYFAYLRATNKVFTENDLKGILSNRGYGMSGASRIKFIQANPPVDNNSTLKPAMNGNTALLINTTNPRESFKISDNSGKLVKANIPTSLARQLLGGQAAALPAEPTAGRRGRPAGVANRPATPAQPAAAGDINVAEVMQETGLDVAFLRLPRAILRKLNVTNATRVAPNGDRGAARRNNQLGGRGQVGRVISVGASKIYFIRLANGRIIASINVQPGNSNYILLPNENGNAVVSLNSPSELLSALQQRNLAEAHRYIVNEYFENYPQHVVEFKKLLRQHLNK